MYPFGWTPPVTVNTRGIPFLSSNGITVSTTSVDISFGYRRLSSLGVVVLELAEAIPTGTTATLPVQIAMGGDSVPITTFGGTAVTAGDLVGTGKILAFYDRFKNALQVFPGIV